MITISDLRAIAKARLEDAWVLFNNHRLDGAKYLCGYAAELTLKARICATLNWSGYPETRGEFQNYKSFQTHNLDVLLRLSGQETRIKSDYLWEWSGVSKWDPETRYKPIGQTRRIEVAIMLSAAETLLEGL